MSSRHNYHQGEGGYPAAEHLHELSVPRSRIKSAFGRLNTPPREQVIPEFCSVRRAHSANSSRGMSSSMSFPRDLAPAEGQTMYGEHFHGSFTPRASLRPHSPTRRNNPHPNKSFMAWRLPSQLDRTEENELRRETARLLRRDSQERFYQEYSGEGKPPAEQDGLLTVLTTAPPPLPDTSSSIYGQHDISYFRTRRPSLDGIAGGSQSDSGSTSPNSKVAKSRYFTGGKSTHGPSHHRSRSETDTKFLKNSLKKRMERHRTNTEPLQHTLYKEPEIWHHRSVRDPPPHVVHRTSMFAAPKATRGMHFRIHPEWPDLN